MLTELMHIHSVVPFMKCKQIEIRINGVHEKTSDLAKAKFI